jgi:hypothetical protein
MAAPAVPVPVVTAVVIGAGNRGKVYAHYAAEAPARFRIVGVAEVGREWGEGCVWTHTRMHARLCGPQPREYHRNWLGDMHSGERGLSGRHALG